LLIFLKIFHFIIWLTVAISILYIFFAGIFNLINCWLIIPYLVVCSEGLALIANHWQCPLTKIAQRYATSKKNNFYVHFPKWLLKHHRKILIIIFIIGTIFIIVNLLKKYY